MLGLTILGAAAMHLLLVVALTAACAANIVCLAGYL